MVILSQDGKTIFNFEKVGVLHIDGYSSFYEILFGNYVLGKYTSIENAKRVLSDIFISKEDRYIMPEDGEENV